MKLKNLYIALGLSLLLPSCKSDEPAPVEMQEKPYVTFTLSLSGKSSRSGDPFGHAWSNDGDDAGTAFDNKIKSVTPVLYAAPSDELVTEYPVGEITDIKRVVSPGVFSEDFESDTDGTVTFIGALKTDFSISQLQQGKYRLVVYVNSDSQDLCGGGINIKNPATTVFHHHGKAGDKHTENGTEYFFNGIPMYGVADVSFANITPADHPTAETAYTLQDKSGGDLVIPMLRSMGKVRITVDKANKGKEDAKGQSLWLGDTRKVKLQEFTISKHNTKGYVVPKGWDKKSSVSQLNTSTAFYPVAADYNHGCTVNPGTSNDGNQSDLLQFYLPETVNNTPTGTSTEDDAIKLTVKYSIDGNDDEDDWLKNEFYISLGGALKDATGGYVTQWDIFRNTIYEFNIVKVRDNFSLDLQVSVKDWGYHKISTTL